MTENKSYAVVGAALLAAAMWFWVQAVLIPHQVSDSAAAGRPRGNLSDLYPRWLGARELLLHGRDPYGSDITREIQIGYYGRALDASHPNDPKDQQAFAYPLYVVFLLAPTVGLPFSLIQHGFFWILAAITAASMPLWLRAFGGRVALSAHLIWIVLTLGSFPAIQGLKLQQLTLLVAGLMAAAVYAITRRHLALAGVLLACATIKPQLVALLLVWLCIWAVGNWKERQRLLWSFGVSMLVLLAGSEYVLPGWLAEFRAATHDYYRYTGGGNSVLDVLLTPLWGQAASVVLVCAFFALTWRLRRAVEGSPEFYWSLGLVTATTLAVIPMFAPYNQILLLPALIAIVQAFPRLWKQGGLARFLTGVTVVAVFWPWVAAAAEIVALAFLPSATVQRVWMVPLYTSFAIPVSVLGLLLISRKVFVSPGTEPVAAAPASAATLASR
jgi:Glycosyltransferase family 87